MKDTATHKKYALKCFTREVAERKDRYNIVSKFIKKQNSQFFCDYEYIDNEFFIQPMGEKEHGYPVVKMEWIDGQTLNKFIEEKTSKNDKKALELIFKEWLKISKYLIKNKIAHGDLKHDNMIIKNSSKIVLIDYDGFFVPQLKGKKALENGSPNYQHPNRDDSLFNEKMDYFSITVIALSLKVLSIKPNLYKKFNNGENIIFLKKDFEDLHNSELIKEIKNISDSEVKKIFTQLEKSLSDINYQPEFLKNSNLIEVTKKSPFYFIFPNE